MSQPVQYSNLFFETDPNSLAARLVNSEAKPKSDVESAWRNNQLRPASQLTVSQTLQSQTIRHTVSDLYLQQNQSQNSQNPQNPRILSRSWDPVTPKQYTVSDTNLQRLSSNSVSSTLSSQRMPASSNRLASLAPTSTPHTRRSTSDLLNEQILPRNLGQSTQSDLVNASSASGILRDVRAVSSAVPIAASNAPTFRPPRPVVLSKPNQPANDNPRIGDFFKVEPREMESESSYETSCCFAGDEPQSLPRTLPGPAMDAWIDVEVNTPAENPEREVPTRNKYVAEDRIRYGHAGTFNKGPWLSFCEAYEQPVLLESASSGTALINTYNCEAILSKGLGNNAQKVPFLALVVIKLRYYEHYATATLADPTGDIEAEIHEDVLKSDSWIVQEGAVMVLRRVTICRPLFLGEEISTHTLIITPANVEQVYPASAPVPTSFRSILSSIIQGQTLARPHKLDSCIKEDFVEGPKEDPTDLSAELRHLPTLPAIIPQPSHIASKRSKHSVRSQVLPENFDDISGDEEEFDDFYTRKPPRSLSCAASPLSQKVQSFGTPSRAQDQPEAVKSVGTYECLQDSPVTQSTDLAKHLRTQPVQSETLQFNAMLSQEPSAVSESTVARMSQLLDRPGYSKQTADDVAWLEDDA